MQLLQTVTQRRCGLESEQVDRFRGVAAQAQHVTRAWWVVPYQRVTCPGDGRDGRGEFVDRDLATLTEVDCLADRFVTEATEDHATGRVGDEGEVARLGAVSEDNHRQAHHRAEHELGNHLAAVALVMGTWPERVERPHDDGGHVVRAVEGPRVALAGQLARPVHRHRERRMLLGHRRPLRGSVHLGARDGDEPGNVGALRKLQQAQRSRRIDLVVVERVVQAVADAETGEMEHSVDAGHQLAGDAVVTNVADDHFDIVGDVGEVRQLAVGEVVEHDHLMASGSELTGNFVADEARATRDQDAFGLCEVGGHRASIHSAMADATVCWSAAVSSGYMGSDSTSAAAASACGKSPAAYPRSVNAGCMCTGVG